MLPQSTHPSEVHGMAGKRKSVPAVATEAAAQAVLRRDAVRALSSDEEKVMRMRLGASPPRTATLERVGQGFPETEIDLLAMEIEAYLHLGRPGRGKARAPAPAATTRAKERIIRALRKKR
jgi:DNA-directed RNA polymerase sigma subunit (sigma70/sigma32)